MKTEKLSFFFLLPAGIKLMLLYNTDSSENKEINSYKLCAYTKIIIHKSSQEKMATFFSPRDFVLVQLGVHSKTTTFTSNTMFK